MDEKRRQGRARSFLKGQIVFNNRSSSLDCVVRNISARGAKLHVTESVTIPDRFDLAIPQRGETLRARLKWRRNDEVGVAFVGAAQADEPAPDVALRLRELEAENAVLKRLLAEMRAGEPDLDGTRTKAS